MKLILNKLIAAFSISFLMSSQTFAQQSRLYKDFDLYKKKGVDVISDTNEFT
jgi:hypothetical protein